MGPEVATILKLLTNYFNTLRGILAVKRVANNFGAVVATLRA